jgi:hypothetical protein
MADESYVNVPSSEQGNVEYGERPLETGYSG